MELELSGLIPAQIVEAICDTLIHSLWEGLILAMVTAITILLTKKSSSDLRYKLLTGYLVVFTAGIFATFIIQLAKPALVQGQMFSGIADAVQNKTIVERAGVGSNHRNLFSVAYEYLNSRSSTVVLIWFLVMWVKYLRFAGGLYHIYCLKRRQLLPAGRYWERKLDELSESLGVKTKVAIVQSGLTKVPITLGHLKPLVLVPFGLLNNLSADEVEAILMHELSHIRRKDYLVNMLQCILEIIFFFNPALLWLSALIKAERENCCDDIVISKTSDKATYIQALLSCQEYHTTKHALAMGLSGKKSSLIGRVRRIVSNNNQTLNVMEKGFLTFSMLTAILITLTVSSTDARAVRKAITVTQKVLMKPFEANVKEPVQQKTTRSVQRKAEKPLRETSVADTLKKSRNHVVSNENGKRYEFELVNGAVTGLYVDGKKIPEADMAQYQPDIDAILARGKEVAKRAEEAGARAIEANARAKEANARAKETADDKKLNAEAAIKAKVRSAQATLRGKASDANKEIAEERAKEAGIRAALSEARAKESEERAKRSQVRAEKVQAEALKTQSDISATLVSAGVIQESAAADIRLSADELIVNGQKQSPELQKKLSDKYITRKGMVFNVVINPTQK
jgi:bla regulator protein BlaR1